MASITSKNFNYYLIPIIALLGTMMILYACKKEKVIQLPTIITIAASEITNNSATAGGNVTSDGGASVTARGVCWSTTPNPSLSDSSTVDGTGTGTFVSILNGLNANTIYYVRAYATNSEGTAFGNELSFKTVIGLPNLITYEVFNIHSTFAFSGGNIIDSGGDSIIDHGVCWATTENPTISNDKTSHGPGTGSFTSNIIGLAPETNYYMRAYATNSAGTQYGNQLNFTTKPSSSGIIFNPDLTYGIVTDIDGNNYKTIEIGTQFWMAENLRTTRLNDETSIPYMPDNSAWSSTHSPAYCYCDISLYGMIYNYYTVETEKLCPIGWHVPTGEDLVTLTEYLGGESIAGGKLKETGTSHWLSPNTEATNISGFTALPSGERNLHGGYRNFGYQGRWWKKSDTNIFVLDYSISSIWLNVGCARNCGMTVRCIKD